MPQTTTILKAIAEFLLGRKYYANIINTKGTDRCEISSIIFTSKEDAMRHRIRLSSTYSYQWVETISFRSRLDYDSTIKRYNNHIDK